MKLLWIVELNAETHVTEPVRARVLAAVKEGVKEDALIVRLHAVIVAHIKQGPKFRWGIHGKCVPFPIKQK